MKRIRRLRGVGAALSISGSLWVASAFAQDAGVDAAAPNEQGPLAAGTLVYPPAGATDVVLNPGLILRLAQTSLIPSTDPRLRSTDTPALGDGLLLRDDSGRLIAAGGMLAVETARPFGAPQPLPNVHVEISTEPFELSPQTHYQVLSRVAVCPAEDGARVVCLQDEFVEIGDFRTGSELDRQAPTITALAEGPSPGQCLTALSVVAADDHATTSELRFAIDAVAYLGPDVVLPTPGVPINEPRTTVSVVALDPSNNRGPAFEVDVESCYLPVTDTLQAAPASSPPVSRDAASAGSGCTLAPRQAPSAIGGVSLSALLTVLLTARRRARQSRRSR
jgi:hypothetical protein